MKVLQDTGILPMMLPPHATEEEDKYQMSEILTVPFMVAAMTYQTFLLFLHPQQYFLWG